MQSIQEKALTPAEQAQKVFMEYGITTDVGSLSFVKRMLTISLSTVAYIRGVFPEDAFLDKKCEDLKLKLICRSDRHPEAKHFVDLLYGVFDAMERKYCRKLKLGFYTNEEDPDTVVESYEFKFEYSSPEDGKETSTFALTNETTGKEEHFSSEAADTMRQMKRMLRNVLYSINVLNVLPDDIMIIFKLLYYPQTPSDYEPPGFGKALFEDFKFAGNVLDVDYGDVATRYHKTCVKVRSIYFKPDKAPLPPLPPPACVYDKHKLLNTTKKPPVVVDLSPPVQSTASMSIRHGRPVPAVRPVPVQTKSRSSSPTSYYVAESAKEPTMDEDASEADDAVSLASENFQKDACDENSTAVANAPDSCPIVCPCNCTAEDSFMVACSGECGTKQHARCYGFSDTMTPLLDHHCYACATESSPCEDNFIQKAKMTNDPTRAMAHALYRRALWFLYSREKQVVFSKQQIGHHLNLDRGKDEAHILDCLVDKLKTRAVCWGDADRLGVDRTCLGWALKKNFHTIGALVDEVKLLADQAKKLKMVSPAVPTPRILRQSVRTTHPGSGNDCTAMAVTQVHDREVGGSMKERCSVKSCRESNAGTCVRKRASEARVSGHRDGGKTKQRKMVTDPADVYEFTGDE